MTLRVALVIDNPYRDLPGLVLVAGALCRAGVTCFLVPMDGQDLELRALAPDAAVLNYLRPGNDALARQLMAADVDVFVLDTEGGVFASLDRYTRTLTPDADLRRGVAGYLSWGPRLSQHLVAGDWFTPEQVVVTGSPRFDFYADPWRQAAMTASGADDGRPLLLVNGNFPVANPRFQTPEAEARMLVDRFGFDAADVADWQRIQLGNVRDLAALTNHVARRFPDVAVIYRPHPFERAETYNALLDDRANLRLVKEGSVDGWILRAAAVIQRSCTTAVEAAMAGVPALSPAWIVPHTEMEAAERVSLSSASIEQMEHHLERALAGDLHPPQAARMALDEIVADWFLRLDGRAHQRIADAIVARSHAREPARRAAQAAVIGTDGSPAGNARRLLKTVLPPAARRLRPGRRETAWRRSEKEFRSAHVKALVGAVAAAGGQNMHVVPARPDYQRWLPFGRSITLTATG